MLSTSIKISNVRKEAHSGSEVARRNAFRQRTTAKKPKWSNSVVFLLRKSIKSMKGQRPEAARSKVRTYNSIFFQKEAQMEQLRNGVAILEQFEADEMRRLSARDAKILVEDSHFELLLGCCMIEPLGVWVSSKGVIGERTWQNRSVRRTN